ncbi:guanine deaminase, putative [Trypanosoma brucei brucei TREU927]|uniref:Guanine deaminase n=2 Tax=Trypanosoma brucei TaxID=5691 RepID=Q57X48_TRYB2|nr:guanine deaminase, putative [Trypanosoma brucei brucei TREU927]AAX69828.1 guanine deaminase, putative [Trypanosoma brucei]AAX70771.1 guanine deaminase, putative [Trypanosoma brucei]AAZ11567.1 guanine deaminase, putative [Trypanosoma brucei brucei TREU927]
METAVPVRYFLGTLIEAPARDTLIFAPRSLVCVGADGCITAVLQPNDIKNESGVSGGGGSGCGGKSDNETYEQTLKEARRSGALTVLKDHQYLLPGLIDLHVHAPQWPQLGKALDRPLEIWLHEYTFPLEAKYADLDFAATSYNSLVSTLLAHGTTTAVYFATIHVDASLLLARVCLEKGQRAVVGRVAMDLASQCPAYYRDASPQESIERSEIFIQAVRKLPGNDNSSPLVLPAVVPRFIPTSSDEALQGLGRLVAKYGCHVQSHVSESDWEHHHVLERCGKPDAFALDDAGLLTRRTVLAHGNFLSDADMKLLCSRGSAVAHCPLSNFYFSGAVFPLRRALDFGLRVGLGTDISGGPSPAIWDAARDALMAARALESGVDPTTSKEERGGRRHANPEQSKAEDSNGKKGENPRVGGSAAESRDSTSCRINSVEAFWLATTRGGEALDLKVGRLAAGFHFDAVVVDVSVPTGGVHIFQGLDGPRDIFDKIVYGASAANVVQTYVAGRLVHGRVEL